MEVYLDNSATTRCFQDSAELMVKILTESFGNPSSMHQKGVDAEKYITWAKQIISRELKVTEKEIYFTSGGTESNNLSILGVAMANNRRGKHLITTKIEHPSVKNPMLFLEKQGFEITWLSVDEKGIVDLNELKNSIREDTILVSIMHVNNEIGSIQPLEEISKIIKSKNSNTYFHVDSVQGIGKFKIHPKKIGIDLLSASGHKFHGPKGIGFVYIDEKVKIQPILFGGGQQNNMRSGTENVPAIAAMAHSLKKCYENLEEKNEKLYLLKEYMINKFNEMEDVIVHGPTDRSAAPGILSASFVGARSEVMLHTLEEKGIYVSAGSACSSHKKTVSDTLSAIGLSKKEMESNIRFSLGEDITKEQIEYCIEVIENTLPFLRKYRAH